MDITQDILEELPDKVLLALLQCNTLSLKAILEEEVLRRMRLSGLTAALTVAEKPDMVAEVEIIEAKEAEPDPSPGGRLSEAGRKSISEASKKYWASRRSGKKKRK